MTGGSSMRLSLPLLLLCYGLACAAEAEPKLVAEQIEQIRPAVERAKVEYLKKVRAENDRLVRQLETAMQRETKAGNLEGALALKAALERAKDGVYLAELMNPTYEDLLGAAGQPSGAQIELPPHIASATLAEGKTLSPNKSYVFGEVPKELAGLRYAQFNHRESRPYVLKASRAGLIHLAMHRNAPVAEFEKLGFVRTELSLPVTWNAGNLLVMSRRIKAGEEIAIPGDEWVTPIPLWEAR